MLDGAASPTAAGLVSCAILDEILGLLIQKRVVTQDDVLGIMDRVSEEFRISRRAYGQACADLAGGTATNLKSIT